MDGVGSDGVGHAKHAREDSSDVSPGFRFNINFLDALICKYSQFTCLIKIQEIERIDQIVLATDNPFYI